MALTLSKKCAIEEKSTIDMEKENNRKKVDSFVNSCDYDIKEGDLDMLVYRVYQFNQKYKNLDQDVILGLFKKAWVENNPILKWILENMDEKTMKSAFGEWGKEKQFFDILKLDVMINAVSNIHKNNNTDKCGAIKITMYAGHKN